MTRSPRLALLSIDPATNDPSVAHLAFSYGIRRLEASVRSCPTLQDVETQVIDLRTAEPEAFMAELEAFRPTMIGASLYVWSMKPFWEIAARVKAWDASIPFIAGGPNARLSVFRLPHYRPMASVLDAIVQGEGEGVIRELVQAHRDGDWKTAPGLFVSDGKNFHGTGPVERPDLNAYPSPYHLSLAPRGTTGYLETFRGCPINCTFCQWGAERADRVFSVPYLVRQLEGLRDADVPHVLCCDAGLNLNPRAFRNLLAAEAQVGFLRQVPFDGHLYPTFLTDEHLSLITQFGRAEMKIGIQSFNAQVLRRLGRPFDIERFERVLRVLREHIRIDLELMIGLPGDTPESFRETFHRAIELGDTVRVFRTLVLPDALLDRADPSMQLDFDPETFLMRSCAGWSEEQLARELDHVAEVARTHSKPSVTDTYVEFATYHSDVPHRPGQARIDLPAERGVVPVEVEIVERLRMAVDAGVQGWSLRVVRNQVDGVYFDLDMPGGRISLHASRRRDGARYFEDRDGVAYVHRGPVEREQTVALRHVIDLVHGDARRLVTEGG
ncbi:MAG: B12-binding domain-containing radical SAM protein [Polyangiaceae bacterium]|nr:B12-binding domain-containing radical SAM protein [Polyangiaceae bacterium]